VEQHYRIAFPLVQVVIIEAVSGQIMGLEVVKVPDFSKRKAHLQDVLGEGLSTE
jgi:hypothetical protein